jgi:hypothetical protein
MKFQNFLHIGAAVVSVFGLMQYAEADFVTYDFDDGTHQGWTNVLTSPDDPPTAFQVSDRTDAAQSPSIGKFFRPAPN